MNFNSLADKILKEMALYSKEGDALEGFLYIPKKWFSENFKNAPQMIQKISENPELLKDSGIFWSRFEKEDEQYFVFSLSDWKAHDPQLSTVPEYSKEGQPLRK